MESNESRAREEAQEYYVMRFNKERNFALSGQPERRGKRKLRWPRSKMERAELRRLELEFGK